MISEPAPLSGLRLLLVEDETMVAMLVEDMLLELGCVVVEVAGSVSTGLALAGDEALAIDGAVLDINLGSETVYPIAQALKAKGVPFIFSTGYSTGGIEADFAGVPILAKPYEIRALERQLMAALRPGASVP
jgi:DNA-binding response OmpR family regulator